MTEYGDVDVIVSVVEYETLLFGAVRDSLSLRRNYIPVATVLTARAKILGDASRTKIARLIIDAEIPPDDAGLWQGALRALEEAGRV